MHTYIHANTHTHTHTHKTCHSQSSKHSTAPVTALSRVAVPKYSACEGCGRITKKMSKSLLVLRNRQGHPPHHRERITISDKCNLNTGCIQKTGLHKVPPGVFSRPSEFTILSQKGNGSNLTDKEYLELLPG